MKKTKDVWSSCLQIRFEEKPDLGLRLNQRQEDITSCACTQKCLLKFWNPVWHREFREHEELWSTTEARSSGLKTVTFPPPPPYTQADYDPPCV